MSADPDDEFKPIGVAAVGAIDQMALAYIHDGTPDPGFWDGLFTFPDWCAFDHDLLHGYDDA